jgi:hypothetical protein
MSKEKGWIRLHRKIQNNPNYFREAFCRNMAWVDLLLLAQHKESHERIRGVRFKTERGQVGLSLVELAKRWRWSRSKVFRFLNELEMDGQIEQQKTNVTTLISIVNYDTYQTNDTANDTADEQQTIQQTSSKRAADLYNEMNTNKLQAPKNDKNVNNDKEDNRGKGDLASPLTPLQGFHYLPDGRSYIEPTVFFTKADFNGLPETKNSEIRRFLKVTKDVIRQPEEISELWESFKEMELTFQKPYRNTEDVYRHFLNWTKKQTFKKGETGKRQPTTKKKEKIVGIEFINNYSQCKMSDGSVVDLNANQSDSAKYSMINPSSIVKN